MMVEGIASRLGRLIRGGARSLVDALENTTPGAERTRRALDHAIDAVRAELGGVIARRNLTSRDLAEARARLRDLSGKARLALAGGREDLAEAVVARILDVEARIPSLEAAVAEAMDAEAELGARIAALGDHKRELARRADPAGRSAEDFFGAPDARAGGANAELDQLVRESRIRARLEALKAEG